MDRQNPVSAGGDVFQRNEHIFTPPPTGSRTALTPPFARCVSRVGISRTSTPDTIDPARASTKRFAAVQPAAVPVGAGLFTAGWFGSLRVCRACVCVSVVYLRHGPDILHTTRRASRHTGECDDGPRTPTGSRGLAKAAQTPTIAMPPPASTVRPPAASALSSARPQVFPPYCVERGLRSTYGLTCDRTRCHRRPVLRRLAAHPRTGLRIVV